LDGEVWGVWGDRGGGKRRSVLEQVAIWKDSASPTWNFPQVGSDRGAASKQKSIGEKRVEDGNMTGHTNEHATQTVMWMGNRGKKNKLTKYIDAKRGRGPVLIELEETSHPIDKNNRAVGDHRCAMGGSNVV